MCALGGIECRLKQTTDRSDNRDVPLLVPSGVLSGVRPSCDILYHTADAMLAVRMPQQAGTHMYLQSVLLLIIHTNLSKDTNHYSARPYRTADQSTTDTLLSLVSLSLCRPSTSTGCALRGVCHHPGTHMYSQSVWSPSIHTNLSRDTTLYPNRITDTTPCCPSTG